MNITALTLDQCIKGEKSLPKGKKVFLSFAVKNGINEWSWSPQKPKAHGLAYDIFVEILKQHDQWKHSNREEIKRIVVHIGKQHRNRFFSLWGITTYVIGWLAHLIFLNPKFVHYSNVRKKFDEVNNLANQTHLNSPPPQKRVVQPIPPTPLSDLPVKPTALPQQPAAATQNIKRTPANKFVESAKKAAVSIVKVFTNPNDVKKKDSEDDKPILDRFKKSKEEETPKVEELPKAKKTDKSSTVQDLKEKIGNNIPMKIAKSPTQKNNQVQTKTSKRAPPVSNLPTREETPPDSSKIKHPTADRPKQNKRPPSKKTKKEKKVK